MNGRLYRVQFGRSSSNNYRAAVELARRHASYSSALDGGRVVHVVEYDSRNASDVVDLWRLTGLIDNLKSRRIAVDGETLPWSTALGWRPCYRLRINALIPDLYCFAGAWAGLAEESEGLNFWGCKNNPSPDGRQNEITSGAVQDGEFVVDKVDLRASLKKRLARYQYCPALSWAFVEEMIRLLPDSISHDTDGWSFLDASYESSEPIDTAEEAEMHRWDYSIDNAAWSPWMTLDSELLKRRRNQYGKSERKKLIQARGVAPTHPTYVFMTMYSLLPDNLRRPTFEPDARMAWVENPQDPIPRRSVPTRQLRRMLKSEETKALRRWNREMQRESEVAREFTFEELGLDPTEWEAP